MQSTRHASETVLFGKPYRWTQEPDGQLSLHPALKLTEARTPDVPFTWELARAAIRRPA